GGNREGDRERVRSGRAGKLEQVAEAAATQDHGLERAEKFLLRRCGHVERVDDAILHQIFQQRFLDEPVVVPIVEHPAAGEEVDVLAALVVFQDRSARVAKQRRERATVAADVRFEPIDDLHDATPFLVHGKLTIADVATNVAALLTSVSTAGTTDLGGPVPPGAPAGPAPGRPPPPPAPPAPPAPRTGPH